MRLTVLVVIAALAAVGAAPVAAAVPMQTASPVKAHVSPGTGGPHTRFTLSFRTPVQTGPTGQPGSAQRSESVSVQATRHPGCVWSGEMAIPAAAAQQMVHVALTPAHMSAGARAWCTGSFRGTVMESEHFACAPPHLCPMIAIRPQPIAQFTFTVKRRA